MFPRLQLARQAKNSIDVDAYFEHYYVQVSFSYQKNLNLYKKKSQL